MTYFSREYEQKTYRLIWLRQRCECAAEWGHGAAGRQQNLAWLHSLLGLSLKLGVDGCIQACIAQQGRALASLRNSGIHVRACHRAEDGALYFT